MAGVFGVQRGNFDLLRERGRELDDFLKLPLRVAHHGGQFHGVFRHVLHQLEFRAEIGIVIDVILDANAPEAFDQHADSVVRKLQHFQQAGGAADFVHFLGRGIFRFGFALQRHAEQAIASHDVIDELDALRRFDEERRDHARENHDIGQAEDGE